MFLVLWLSSHIFFSCFFSFCTPLSVNKSSATSQWSDKMSPIMEPCDQLTWCSSPRFGRCTEYAQGSPWQNLGTTPLLTPILTAVPSVHKESNLMVHYVLCSLIHTQIYQWKIIWGKLRHIVHDFPFCGSVFWSIKEHTPWLICL